MAKNSTTDIELLAGLNIDSSEQEILRAIKIIQKRIKANTDARFKLNVEIDETVINNTIAKLQNALKNKDLKIETQDSIAAITKEANAMLEVVEAAKRASQEKLDFAKANQQVENSARATAEAINRERTAMNNLDDLDSILQNVNMSGRQGASVFQQFGNSLRDAVATYTTVNLLQEGLEKVVEAGKEAIEITKKYNDINVNLQMATGEDKDYVRGLLDDYAELGGELGALTETVAESADTFLRQGRSMEETNQLIRDAVVLSKVAQTEGEKASEILTATINGFQLAATEGSRVSDVLSSIDLHSASSAQGIGEALIKTASMANNAGISLEKTAAMIATIKDVTQDSDTTIGTSLKTVLSRLSSIKAGKFVDESTEEALNDVEKVLGSIGVSMRDVNGQFKEAESIIDEVGTKWKTLDGNTQKAVTSAMGGTYQANRLVSLFDNYDKVIELTKIAEESAGVSLQKFNESYLPSLEAKTNALKSSLDALATSTISDEFYGSVLDTTKAIVDMTTETGILKGALAGLVTAGTVYTFQHLTAYLREATQEFANLGEAMQITRGANGTITDIQRLIDLTSGLSESQTRLLLSSRNLTDAQRTAILVNQYLAQGMDDDLARATAEATLNTWGLATAQNTANGAAITLRNTLRGLWASLMASPLVAVTVAVTAGVSAFTQYKQKQEEIIQTTKEAARESADLSDELNDLTSKYLSLADAVNNDESAKEDLLDVQDQLIEKLGLERDEIDKLIEKYGILDEKVQNYIQNEAIAKLQEARHDLISGYNTAKNELIAESDSIYGNQWTVFSKENKDALKVLEKKGIGRVTDEYVGDRFYLTGVDSTVEGAVKNFNQLKDALSALEEEYGSDKVKDIGLYNDLYARYLELKPVIESYTESIDELNENAASSLQFTMLKDMEYPDTTEEIELFRQKMLDTALAGKDFVGTQEDIERAVNSVMKTFSSYSKEDIAGSSSGEISTGLLSDKQKESIEEYKALVKKIAEIREDPDSYSLSDLTTEFTSYDWSKFSDGAESLDMALQKIAGGSLADVRTGLEGFSNAEPILEELGELFTKTFEGNDFGWSENLGHYNAVMDLQNKVKEGYKFTKEEITEILGDYDLFGDIKKVDGGYSIDDGALKSFANEYAKKHNESLQRVREELERVGINPDSLLGKNSYKTLIDTSSKGNTSSKDFSDSIDWAVQSISNLEDKVSDLENILDNTKGWEAQTEAIEKVNGALSDLQAGYEKSATTYHNKYEEILNSISDENLRNDVRDSIENGKDFSIDPYIGVNQEELFDKVSEATDYYNKSKEAENNVVEVGFKIKENDLEKLNINVERSSAEKDLAESKLDSAKTLQDKIDIYNYELPQAISKAYDAEIALAEANGEVEKSQQLQLEKERELRNTTLDRLKLTEEYASNAKDLAFSKLDSSLSDSDKLEALDVTKAETDNYYKYAILAARYEYGADSTQVKSLELEWQKELNELKQRELDLLREKDESVISQLEHQKQLVQNQMDLNGGKGTASQYSNLISTENQILTTRNSIYEREIGLLNQIGQEIGVNSTEYREQLKVVNECADGLAECEKNIKDCQIAILNLSLDTVADEIKSLNNQLDNNNDKINGLDRMIAGAVAYIQDEIDAQEEVKNGLQEQLEAMKEANDERERANALEKAKYELQRAMSQRVVKQYAGEGKGFIYTHNQDDVRSAQENLDNLEYEEAVHQLEKQIEYYDDIIADLQEVQNSWSDIADKTQDFLDIQYALAILGEEGIFDVTRVEAFTKQYQNLLKTGENLENSIEQFEEFGETLSDSFEAFENGDVAFEQCLGDMEQTATEFCNATGLNVDNTMTSIREAYSAIDNSKEVAEAKANVLELETETATSASNMKAELKDVGKTAETESAKSSKKVTRTLKTETDKQEDIMDELAKSISEKFQLMCDNVILTATTAFEGISETLKDISITIKDQMDVMIDDAIERIEELKELKEEVEDDGKSDKSSGKTGSGSAGNNYNSSNGQVEIQTFHNGLENGLVGEKDTGDKIKELGLRKLRPDEIPAVLKLNEAVLNKFQQGNIVSNMVSSFVSGMQSSVSNVVPRNNIPTTTVSIGDIHLHEVQNVSDFAKALEKHLPNISVQYNGRH